MATTQICPVVGTTTSSLPPNHPTYDVSNAELRCPVTNATTEHHHVLHNHPSATGASGQDAQACPALKNANTKGSLTDATCPVVGPVSTFLPPDHPLTADAKQGAVCPVTNATLAHHAASVHRHPALHAGTCPVAGKTVTA